MWQSGFLPTRHNGVALRSGADPVLYIQNPPGVAADNRRAMLDGLGKLNAMNHARFGDPETVTRIAQYEMAFRMQTSVPDLVDLKKEPKHILERYGPEVNKPGTFAHSALLARRLDVDALRAGVRSLEDGIARLEARLAALRGDLPDLDQEVADVLGERPRVGVRDVLLQIVERDPDLQTERGAALRALLYLFRRDDAVRTLRAG